MNLNKIPKILKQTIGAKIRGQQVFFFIHTENL